MKSGMRWRYAAGGALVLAVAIFLLTAFYMLSTTDQKDLFLIDTRHERFGWRYELLVNGKLQAYEPAYANEYALVLPEGTQAVRITRTMTEDIPNAELEWTCNYAGVEMFLDNRLLHSDFQETTRDAAGFLVNAQEELQQAARMDPERISRVRMTLPADYVGKELCMVTYFPLNGLTLQPEYPILGNDETLFATLGVSLTIPIATIVISAILALALTIIFLLDLSNNQTNPEILLIGLYFLLLFLNLAYETDLGYYGLLSQHPNLQFLSKLYIAPLYLYLALRLTKWRKYTFCLVVLLWTLCEGIRLYPLIRENGYADFISNGLWALVLFAALLLMLGYEIIRSGRHTDLRTNLFYGLLTILAAVISLYEKARFWGSLYSYLHNGLLQTLQIGNYMPLVSLLSSFCSIMAAILLILEFLRRAFRTRQTVTALAERSRLTLESYQRLLAAEHSSNALRHELRHHLTALSALLESGDLVRARKYLSSLARELDQLPPARYSHNMLVNVIAGTYLDRAQAEGIQIEYRLNVPAELNIADADLSVLLSNLLQNALEACEKMDAARERYIRIHMHLRKNFLLIQCLNSAGENNSPADEERNPREHGYGPAAMLKIARKYDGDLLTKHTMETFEATCYLNLKQN